MPQVILVKSTGYFFDKLREFSSDRLVAKPIDNVGLHITHLATAIMADAFHSVGIDLFLLHQHGDGICQLYLVSAPNGVFSSRGQILSEST